MAFNIKDEAVVDQARRIATQTGESMTEVFARAIAERAQRMERDDQERRARVMRIIRRCQARVAGEPMPDIDALLYDPDTGLPR